MYCGSTPSRGTSNETFISSPLNVTLTLVGAFNTCGGNDAVVEVAATEVVVGSGVVVIGGNVDVVVGAATSATGVEENARIGTNVHVDD
ncbi:unannotated protein [freshwater metagenome]|uniref:Unannotated protein n=1 Tax=freshwater metagenome TaxID=449393 RepID=A0A6J6DXC2_9ZZZZ